MYLNNKYPKTNVLLVFENGDKIDMAQLNQLSKILSKAFYKGKKLVTIVIIHSYTKQNKLYKDDIAKDKLLKLKSDKVLFL